MAEDSVVCAVSQGAVDDPAVVAAGAPVMTPFTALKGDFTAVVATVSQDFGESVPSSTSEIVVLTALNGTHVALLVPSSGRVLNGHERPVIATTVSRTLNGGNTQALATTLVRNQLLSVWAAPTNGTDTADCLLYFDVSVIPNTRQTNEPKGREVATSGCAVQHSENDTMIPLAASSLREGISGDFEGLNMRSGIWQTLLLRCCCWSGFW